MTGEDTRDTAVLYRLLPDNKSYLLICLPTRNDVQLVRFEGVSGALHFTETPKLDVFQSRDEALEYLQKQGELKVEGRGVAILGYVVIGNTGLLLMVEKARVSAVLPGDIKIKTVAKAKWYRIPCQADLATENQSAIAANYETIENRISKITEFPIHGAHWYCEEADVTRPFPSDRSTNDPSWQFTWNAWLTESFRSVNLGFCCPALMEGTAESKDLEDGIGDPFKIVLLSRRTRLNPGTRYIARGLNDLCEPGNEIECEQIVWRPPAEPGGKTMWNRYSWRRGTVPIRWGVILKNSGLGEAEIVIRNHKTFSGCRRYIRRLQKRFMPRSDIEASLKESKGDCDTSEKFPIVFISLLRKGLPDKFRSETNLAAAFDMALSKMRKLHKLNVAYYALDWHEMDKQLGTQGLIEALWTTMKGMLRDHSLASGYYSHQASGIDSQGAKTDWVGEQTISWHSQQLGLARYNCADSLDRTNIASFFICVQVFVEQCRRLQLAVLNADEETNEVPATVPKPKMSLKDKILKSLMPGTSLDQTQGSPSKVGWQSTNLGRKNKPKSSGIKLPVGWEAKVDVATGCTYYVDHVHKRTTWTPPPQPRIRSDQIELNLAATKSFRTRCREEILSTMPWSMLNASVDEVRLKVLPEALSSIAEVFLQNGDRNAFFYTGSQAMHSDKIMIFEPDTSLLKKHSVGGASNSFIALTRRYNNIVKDSERQIQIELFLGINLEKYFLSSAHLTLDSMNIVYKPKEIVPDGVDTDDEADEVNQMNYPEINVPPIIVPVSELETSTRSLSTPNLSTYDSKAGLAEVIDEEGVEDKIKILKTDAGLSEETDTVTGLRELSTTSNPLL